MLVFRYLAIFLVVVLFKPHCVHPNTVSGFNKIVSQVLITTLNQRSILGIEITRLIFIPNEAGILGKSSFIIKPFDISNFGDDTSSKDVPNAGDSS